MAVTNQGEYLQAAGVRRRPAQSATFAALRRPGGTLAGLTEPYQTPQTLSSNPSQRDGAIEPWKLQ